VKFTVVVAFSVPETVFAVPSLAWKIVHPESMKIAWWF